MSQMGKNKNPAIFDRSFLFFLAIAFVGAAACLMKGKAFFFQGLDASASMAWEVTPRIIPAFLLAGFIQILVPKEFIMKWIGAESGFKGILIALCAGMITPGGPILSFPIISALYRMGADYGPLVAYLASWEILGLQRIIVWELPFMGARFVTLRFLASLVLPIIAGVLAKRVVRIVGNSMKVTDG